jgi:hypothetical protein
VTGVAKSKVDQENSLKPELASYIEDNIFGIVWNWSRNPLSFEDSKLTPYCPECQTRLEMQGAGGDISKSPTAFYCEHCEKIIKELPDSPVDLDRKIWKEIERRKRTGEWEQAIKLYNGGQIQLSYLGKKHRTRR